ncbi:MAG: anthranilate synthase component I [Gemmatimonadales bacterium]|nr:MAG: anthranilate synthase component I [Gemmatimonadales bacterium]
MELVPSFEEFCRLARRARVVPVRSEFLFDVDTAVTACHKLSSGPFTFLLESVVGGETWARYSFVGSSPRAAWRLSRGTVSWWTPDGGWVPVECDEPLDDLDRRLQALDPSGVDAEIGGLPRFWGGAVGYFGYDIVRQVEDLPHAPPADLDLPEALVVFTDVVLAIDNFRGRAMAIRSVPVEPHMDEARLRALWDETREVLDETVRTLRTAAPPEPLVLGREPEGDPPFRSTVSREDFGTAVEKVRDYIHAGDVFQVVLSQRLDTELSARPFDLYRAIRTLNPSPYLYYLELDGVTLVGSSPEVLTRMEDGRVTVRPIAGTRPRGSTPEEDRALEADLRADEKELAEHRMLVDLGRNDVGRVARYGSVTVPDLMVVERYSHVMHLVSQVEGEVRDGLSALDVLRASFPAGTVSGAPKIRAMEIIDELEPVGRGPYAGAVGHLGWGGQTMDTAIAIRTVLARDGRAYVQAGAGIVADSRPDAEYEETLNKARALLRASAMVGGEGRAEPDTPPDQPGEPTAS